MLILGLTGQTGAGKSTVLQVIEGRGGLVIDCDRLYWKTLAENTTLQQRLRDTFGDISDENGGIDRKKLGAVVFQNPDQLARLNQLTHPLLNEIIFDLIEKARKDGYLMVAVDAIALIESGLGEKCDKILAVVAEEETRMTRIQQRDGISLEYAKNRVESQKKQSFYEENSDMILENNEKTKELFLVKVEKLMDKLEGKREQ